jgi:hypothetical protein
MTYPLELTLTNPGFETGNLAGWTATNGFAGAMSSLSGDAFSPESGLYAATLGKAGSATLYQEIVLDSSVLADVDAGSLKVGGFSAYHRTFSLQDDHGALFIAFLNAAGTEIGYVQSEPDFTKGAWSLLSIQAHPVPSLTRTVRLGVIGVRMQGDDLDSYWDGFSSPFLDINAFTSFPISYERDFNAIKWTNDTAVVSASPGAHGTLTSTWAHASNGACHKDVAIPAAMVTAVDAGDVGIFVSALQNSAQLTRDSGRFTVSFLDALGAQMGPATYSSISAFVGMPVGTQGIVQCVVPTTTRNVRVGLIGVRDPIGDDLVTGFNRVFVGLTNEPSGGGVNVFLADLVRAELAVSAALAVSTQGSLSGELKVSAEWILDPPFLCARSTEKTWELAPLEVRSWTSAGLIATTWKCASDQPREIADLLAFVDASTFVDLGGDHLKLIG